MFSNGGDGFARLPFSSFARVRSISITISVTHVRSRGCTQITKRKPSRPIHVLGSGKNALHEIGRIAASCFKSDTCDSIAKRNAIRFSFTDDPVVRRSGSVRRASDSAGALHGAMHVERPEERTCWWSIRLQIDDRHQDATHLRNGIRPCHHLISIVGISAGMLGSAERVVGCGDRCDDEPASERSQVRRKGQYA